MAQVAVCSQINTKHINTVQYSCWMLNCWCITWPVGFKSLNVSAIHPFLSSIWRVRKASSYPSVRESHRTKYPEISYLEFVTIYVETFRLPVKVEGSDKWRSKQTARVLFELQNEVRGTSYRSEHFAFYPTRTKIRVYKKSRGNIQPRQTVLLSLITIPIYNHK